MSAQKTRYRLFACSVTVDNADKLSAERFLRITPEYMLFYTDKRKSKNSIEIKGQDLKRLSKADEKWLLECNLKLIAEETMKRADEISGDVLEQLEELEKELAAEKEKGERENGESDGGTE